MTQQSCANCFFKEKHPQLIGAIICMESPPTPALVISPGGEPGQILMRPIINRPRQERCGHWLQGDELPEEKKPALELIKPANSRE